LIRDGALAAKSGGLACSINRRLPDQQTEPRDWLELPLSEHLAREKGQALAPTRLIERGSYLSEPGRRVRVNHPIDSSRIEAPLKGDDRRRLTGK
jgi:hypothetical protein